MKIHPIIEMQLDGSLGVKDKAYGSRKKSMQLLLTDFEKHLDELDPRGCLSPIPHRMRMRNI